jgi:hypothetical protein
MKKKNKESACVDDLILYGYILVSNITSFNEAIYFVAEMNDELYIVENNLWESGFLTYKLPVNRNNKEDEIYLEHLSFDFDAFGLRIGESIYYIDSKGNNVAADKISKTTFSRELNFKANTSGNILEIRKKTSIKGQYYLFLQFGIAGSCINDAKVVGYTGKVIVVKCEIEKDYFFMIIHLKYKKIHVLLKNSYKSDKKISLFLLVDSTNSQWDIFVWDNCGCMYYNSREKLFSCWCYQQEGLVGLHYKNLDDEMYLGISRNNPFANNVILFAGEEMVLYKSALGWCLRYKRHDEYTSMVEHYYIKCDSNMQLYCTDGRTVYGIENGKIFLFFAAGLIVNKTIKFE